MLSYEPSGDQCFAIAKIKRKRSNNLVYLCPESGGDLGNISDSYYSADDEPVNNNELKKITLEDTRLRFSIYPSEKGLDKIYLCGPSGAGKTSIIQDYVKQYVKMFPNKNIYLFSDVNQDDLLDDIKKIKRIRIEDDLIDDPIETKELEDSLLIFDDIDSFSNPKLLKTVRTILDSCLKRGRHEEIRHIIVTNHLTTDYKNTRCILNEASHVIFFPACGGSNNYLMKSHIGLDPNQIRKVNKLKSRWVCALKRFPRCMITENQVFLLDQL